MSMEREEKLFLAIGGVDDRLIEAAADPRKPRHSSHWGRWAAVAAAVVVVAGAGLRYLPIGGAGSGTHGIRGNGNEALPGDAASSFMSYAGAVMPLTVLSGPEGLPAERQITWDFDTEDATKYTLCKAEVTDETTIRNPGEMELTVTVGYPVTATLRYEDELLPTLTVNGDSLETTLLWGDTGAVQGSWPKWAPRLEGWEDLKALLAGSSYLDGSREAPPALDYTVTVWEVLEETAPDGKGKDLAPTLAIDFKIDPEKTEVYSWGFNGYSWSEDGTSRYDFFVRGDGERPQRRLLVFLGEAPGEYVMEGYENGGCERVLEGVSGRLTAFTTTLGELLDRLAEEDFSEWDSAGGMEGREDTFRAALHQMMERFISGQAGESELLTLEDLFSHVLVSDRVVWTTAEVTIPAGGEVTVAARYWKEPSYDFACGKTDREGLLGWDLGTTLGSSLNFRKMIARLENAGGISLEGQNFGFDLKNGVTQVELVPTTEHYYMEVRIKGN